MYSVATPLFVWPPKEQVLRPLRGHQDDLATTDNPQYTPKSLAETTAPENRVLT